MPASLAPHLSGRFMKLKQNGGTRTVAPLASTTRRAKLHGVFAALFTVLLWSSWIITSKLGMSANIPQFDMALIRYGFPALGFSFFVFRARRLLLGIPRIHLWAMCFGAGLPFFYLGTLGMKFAPATHAGILIPGTFPFFVSLIAVVVYRESLSLQRALGLAAIFLGIVVLIVPEIISASDYTLVFGHLLFLAASLCWSCFTVSMRVSGVPPLAASGVFSLFSVLGLALFFVLGGRDSDVHDAAFSDKLDVYFTLFAVQGVMVGLLAGFSFGFAIHRLGAEKTAALGALTPVVSMVLAAPVLGEVVSLSTLFALFIVCLGVLSASGLNLLSIFKMNLGEGGKRSVVVRS